MGIVGASVRTAQQQGYGTEPIPPTAIALATSLLFERFTSVSLSQGLPDDAAVTTLSTIWKKTIYGTLKKE